MPTPQSWHMLHPHLSMHLKNITPSKQIHYIISQAFSLFAQPYPTVMVQCVCYSPTGTRRSPPAAMPVPCSQVRPPRCLLFPEKNEAPSSKKRKKWSPMAPWSTATPLPPHTRRSRNSPNLLSENNRCRHWATAQVMFSSGELWLSAGAYSWSKLLSQW
jgi:hypothetical protein